MKARYSATLRSRQEQVKARHSFQKIVYMRGGLLAALRPFSPE